MEVGGETGIAVGWSVAHTAGRRPHVLMVLYLGQCVMKAGRVSRLTPKPKMLPHNQGSG